VIPPDARSGRERPPPAPNTQAGLWPGVGRKRPGVGTQTLVPLTFQPCLRPCLDRVATDADPVYITGDFNIRLESLYRSDGLHAAQLRYVCHGLELHASGPTHQLGGIVDAVITHDAAGRPDCVSVEGVGLSDHFVLRWGVDFTRTVPSTSHICSRSWRQLDLESSRSALSASKLCQPDEWLVDVHDIAVMYDSELNAQLDRLLPLRQFDRRQRPSDPWFDKECRSAKRLTRRLERAFSAASRRSVIATTFADYNAAEVVAEADAAKTAWYNQRRSYHPLRRIKSAEFWRGKVEGSQSDPQTVENRRRLTQPWPWTCELRYWCWSIQPVFCEERCQRENKHCWCTGAGVYPCATWCLFSAAPTADDWWRHQCYSTTPWQDIGCWSHFDINVEADWWSCRIIPHWTVQPVAVHCSGGATPGRGRSNNLAGRSTALVQALAPPCLACVLLCFGN